MEKFGKSQPVRRLEDRRFLTGAGRYVDDVVPGDALHAVLVRSQVAHGHLAAVDLEEARGMPGVVLAMGSEDLAAMGVDYALGTKVVTNRDGSAPAEPRRPILAEGKVRFVGDPVAVVVAETREQAKDAAESVFADVEELGAKLDLAPGGDTVHDEVPDNVAFDWRAGDAAAVDGALAEAAHVVTTRVADNRVICNSMEPRGCFAEWDGERLHFCYSGQGVWGMKEDLAACFGLGKEQVRVTTPDVGGGFGMKAFGYPEYFAVAACAKALGRPVRWMSERTEAMLADNSGRDLVSRTTLAFDSEFRILAYKVDTSCNLGAYLSGEAQQIQTELFAKVAMGVYDVQTIALNCKGFFTNTGQVDAYRGAGRPEAMLALERSIDNAARVLGIDPHELRRKNFIPPAKFPYKTAIAETYDVGEFDRVLTSAEEQFRPCGLRSASCRVRGKGAPAGAGPLLLHRIDSRRPDRGRQGRLRGGRNRQPLCRHAVERTRSRDGLCNFPVRPHRHSGGRGPHRSG